MNSKLIVVIAWTLFLAIIIGCGGGGGSATTGTTGTTDGGGTGTRVSGTVVAQGTGAAVPGARVLFYNAAGVQIGMATTNNQGNFNALVPTSAARFHIDETSLGSSYYKAYTYQGLRYSMLIPACTAPLPTLTQDQTTPLPGPIQIPRTTGPPPPPPNGCG
jgi:hypothetical protein